MAELEARRVVVTGATSGIGEALAARLIEEGAQVIGIGRQAARLEEQAARWPDRFVPLRADLADPAARQRCHDTIRGQFGRIDALINNAAQTLYHSPSEVSPTRWAALLEVNLLAAVELACQLAPLLPRGGNVVNISSVTARYAPSARFGPYAVTKAALDSFTTMLRLELDPRGVRVTSIAPGLVETPIYDKVEGFSAAREKLAKQIPRWLSAGEVADAIIWVLARPPHVVVGELTLMPSGQAR